MLNERLLELDGQSGATVDTAITPFCTTPPFSGQ